MSSFFFDRSGDRKAAIIEAVGLSLVLFAVIRALFGRGGLAAQTALFAVLAMYVFIKFCAMRRWNRDSPRYSGIGIHFHKMVKETSYVMAALGALMLITSSWVFPVIAAILLVVAAHINVILLYFHFRDVTEHPVNHYSGGGFLDTGQV